MVYRIIVLTDDTKPQKFVWKEQTIIFDDVYRFMIMKI